MSTIHALSSAHAAVGASAAPSGAAARHAKAAGVEQPPVSSPRHGVGAFASTLEATVTEWAGTDAVASSAAREALGDFRAALFETLQGEGGREVGHGPGRHLQRGHAYGRQGDTDLAGRIEALATQLSSSDASVTESAEAVTTATGEGIESTPREMDNVNASESLANEGPALETGLNEDFDANMVADASEEVVLPVPSPLTASFAALWQALQPVGSETPVPDLSSFLHDLAGRLGATLPMPTLGTLVDAIA